MAEERKDQERAASARSTSDPSRAMEHGNVLRRLLAKRSAAGKTANARYAMPETVKQRFTQVGKRYFFGDGEEAFLDRGRRLSTFSENTALVRMLIDVARARQWRRIEVSGSRRFRQRVWESASRVGVEVEGYRPTRFERAKLAQERDAAERAHESHAQSQKPAPRAQKSYVAPAAASSTPPPSTSTRPNRRQNDLIVGRLVGHDEARYQFRADQPLSYFIKLQTERGVRVLWGKDLPRAISSSQTKVAIGDVVGARRVGREAVTVLEQQRDANGKVISQRKQEAHRNQWVVEKVQFFVDRARVARQLRDGQLQAQATARAPPEARSTFTTLHAAAEFAAAKIQHPEDRAKFMQLLRERLAESAERRTRGDHVGSTRLHRAGESGSGPRTKGSRSR